MAPACAGSGGVEHLVFVDGSDLYGIRPSDGKIMWTAPWNSLNHLNGVSPGAAWRALHAQDGTTVRDEASAV